MDSGLTSKEGGNAGGSGCLSSDKRSAISVSTLAADSEPHKPSMIRHAELFVTPVCPLQNVEIMFKAFLSPSQDDARFCWLQRLRSKTIEIYNRRRWNALQRSPRFDHVPQA